MKAARHLSVAERIRLVANVRWLLAEKPGLRGLRKRLSQLNGAQRAHVGEFTVAIAAADGVIEPAEVRVLTRVYKLLDLDESKLFSRLYSVGLEEKPAPARKPVKVRSGAKSQGFTIPEKRVSPASRPPVKKTSAKPPPLPATKQRSPEARSDPKRPNASLPITATTGIEIDHDVLARKKAEAAEASSLLASIFAEVDGDEAPTEVSSARTDTTSDDGDRALLDGDHRAFLIALMSRVEWSRSEVEQLASTTGLLVDGALETLNEAAFELTGDPVADGDATIEVDPEIAEELLQ